MKSLLAKTDAIANRPDFKRLMAEAQKLNGLPRNLDWKANRMCQIADELAAMVAPIAPCKKNCAHCCYQAVEISKWEAERIAKFSKRKMADFAGYEMGKMQHRAAIDKYNGVACPFLKDDNCSIYAVRPLMCRIHFSIGPNAELCNTIAHCGASIPQFNFTQLHLYQGMIFVINNNPFGDIRHWFPK